MQILPQFDPWGQFGQQVGSGIGNYLTQATDRARFSQNLSAAQKLLEPIQEEGKTRQRTPTEILFGLYEASQGNPAFLQSIGEIYPHLLKEQTRQAGIQSLKDRQLPNGERPNQPPRATGGNKTLGGLPQQAEPYNEQAYADQTGGFGPSENRPEIPQDKLGRNQYEGQSVDENAPPQPGQELLPEYLEPFGPSHPDFETISPEEEQQTQLTFLNSGSTLEEANKALQRRQEAIDKRNAGRQQNYENKRADQKASRELDKGQNAFLDKELESKGWNTDPFYQALARREFLKNQANPNLKSDTAKWEPVRQKLTKVVNAKTDLASSGVGRPYPWQNYDEAVKNATAGTRAFLDAAGFYGKNGERDKLIGDEAINTLMGQDWTRTEATNMVYGLSGAAKNMIRTAPPIYSVSGLPIGKEKVNVINETGKGTREERLREVAEKFSYAVDEYDSLLVMREQFNLWHDYKEQDFTKILQLAEAMGWNPSEFQKSEMGKLAENIYPSLTEIFHGRGLREARKAGRL